MTLVAPRPRALQRCARERSGLADEVLPREEEARLGYLAAANSTTPADGVALAITVRERWRSDYTRGTRSTSGVRTGAEFKKGVELGLGDARAEGGLPLTIDVGEFRNVEYHTGISFTLFARGVRGELGRGGRCLSAAEPATGVTLYLDSLLRALPSPEPAKLLFLPAEADTDEEARRQAEGWRTLRGLKSAADNRAEAKRLGCTHVLAANGIQSVGAS